MREVKVKRDIKFYLGTVKVKIYFYGLGVSFELLILWNETRRVFYYS